MLGREKGLFEGRVKRVLARPIRFRYSVPSKRLLVRMYEIQIVVI